MPVPQENLYFVERASCPFLRMVQDVSYIQARKIDYFGVEKRQCRFLRC